MNIHEELLQNNPFASTAAANPWSNSSPDISSLNGDVCDKIFFLIRSKSQSPREPFAGLIRGEIGSGKTHMLKRILDKIRHDDINTIFVNVKAFSVRERVMRELWREIFVNMLHGRSGKISRFKTTQFNFIVAGMMNIYRRYNALNGILGAGSTDGILHLLNENELPGIHTDFLKAVFAYCDPFDEKRRQAALGWFYGNIDDDHPAILGVNDRSSMSAEELEEEAKKMILSLGLILNLCGASMVVCFDQLDAMEEKTLINAWGEAVAFLIDDVFSMLPLAFLKDSTWRKDFLPVLSEYVVQRFGNEYTLRNCTLEQARELIRVRITSFFGENSDDKFDWIMKQLQGKLQSGYSPRIVLNFANDAILRPVSVSVPDPDPDPDPPPPYEVLDGEYREECDKVAANFAMWQPDKERLLNALEIYLSHNPRFKGIKRSNYKNDKFIFLSGRHIGENEPERDCVFIINTEQHHMKVLAALNRGVSFLSNHPNGICYYITDGRCRFPGPNSWIKVNTALNSFEKLSGKILILDQKQAIQWYGLNELIIKVKSGDVTHISGGEIRTAVMDDLKQYLEKSFSTDLLEDANSAPYEETKKVKKNDKSQLPDDDVIEKYVSEILRSSPMHFMKVEMLLGHLSGKVTITREQLLESLGRLNDKYSLFSSGDGTLVMLK